MDVSMCGVDGGMLGRHEYCSMLPSKRILGFELDTMVVDAQVDVEDRKLCCVVETWRR